MLRLFEKFLYSSSYAILLGIYPMLTLYVSNIDQVGRAALFVPLILSAVFAALMLGLFARITKNKFAAGLMTSVVLISFFSYGHAINALQDGGIDLPAWISFLVWLSASAGWIAAAGRIHPRDLRSNTPALNLIVIILLLFPLFKVLRYGSFSLIPFAPKTDHAQTLTAETKPDIYYIILDSYGRADILKELYGYDNGSFLGALEETGFYVAECAQSNYHLTMLSLGSALNMDYLPMLSDEFAPEKTDRFYLFKALNENAVLRALESSGYQTVAFATGFPWTELSGADQFYAPQYALPIDEFGILALKTTLVRVVDDLNLINLDDITAERHRARSRLVFSSFDDLANMPGPKFVFVHILLPHPPYVFDAQGNPTSPDSVRDADGYPAQTAYVSAEILEGVRTLIAQSAIPPVIILQGDHGPFYADITERKKILNAYYLPDHSDQLYAGISPVNTFRVVFNALFGTTYPLLEDVSYVSDLPYAYDFRVVPNSCPSK